MHHDLQSAIADMNYGEFLLFFAYTFTPLVVGGTKGLFSPGHQVILARSSYFS